MKDRITVFSIDITIKIPLRFFAFRLCRCSTVKSRSKREKLSLKTLIIPRVRLAIEFGSFFIYATILSFFVDFGDCDFNSHLRLLFSVLLRLCRKANKKRFTDLSARCFGTKSIFFSIKTDPIYRLSSFSL